MTDAKIYCSLREAVKDAGDEGLTECSSNSQVLQIKSTGYLNRNHPHFNYN